MAAKLFFLPYTVATVNGIAQPAATLTFYQTGTLTKLPIYTTALLDVQLANPITASGGGRFPDIYLDDTQTYRMIVKDQIGTVLDDVDPYIPGTIAGLVGPTGPAGGGEAIYLTPLQASEAALIEGLIAATANGAEVWFPLGTTTLDRSVIPAKPTTFRGYGGAKGQSGGTGRTHIIAPAGFPAFIFGPNAQQSRVESLKIAQAALLSTTGTASYAGGTATSITGNTLLDIQNNQVIWLEGAGGSLVIPGRTFAVASGSNSVTATSSGSYGNYWGYVGQMVSIAGAGVAAAALVGYIGTIAVGGSFTLVDAAGAALNASTTVTVALVTAFAPLQTRVVSGGGTATLTIDAYPYSSLAVTGAKIRHAAPAIYSTTEVHMRNVEVGGDCQGGLTLAGITTGGNIADNCTAYDCMFAADLFGVSFQGNDAQVNAFYGCDFAGSKISVLDNSFLGNYFYGCHWAFNCGLQSFNNFDQIIGGYFESNTGWATAGGMFFATVSLVNGAGLKGFQPSGGQTIFPYSVFQQTDANNAAFTVNGQADFQGIGNVTIANNGNVFGGSSSATGKLTFRLNSGVQGYIISADDLWLTAASGKAILLRPNGDATTATVDGASINLASGKVLKANGTQVVGAQQAAVADATNATDVITQLNALLAAARTHGFIAT